MERIKSRLRLRCSRIDQRLKFVLKNSTTDEFKFAQKRIVKPRSAPTVGSLGRTARFTACCAKWVWLSYNSMKRLKTK